MYVLCDFDFFSFDFILKRKLKRKECLRISYGDMFNSH